MPGSASFPDIVPTHGLALLSCPSRLRLRRMIETALILVAGVLAVGGTLAWLRVRDTDRRELLQALAARRGWSFSVAASRLGRPGSMRLAQRSGIGWETTVHRHSDTLPGPARWARGSTTFQATAPSWAAGRLRIEIGRRGHGGGPPAPELRLLQAPTGFRLLATEVPRHLDLDAILAFLAERGLSDLADGGNATIEIDAEGFRVRLDRAVLAAERMEDFVDTCAELARLIDRL